jgi:cobalt-zinc-cadmium efflux system outer membrane protein
VLFGAGPTRTPLPGGFGVETGAMAHVEQTLEIGGQRGARRAEVARGVDAASLREALAVVEAQALGRTSYVGALLSGAQLEAARRREELALELETSVRARVDSGAASEIELRLATLERSRVVHDRVAAGQVAGDARAELLALLAYPPDTTLALTTPIAPPAAAVPPLAQAIAEAERRRADLAALDARRSELDAAILRLGREALPSPTVFVDLERDRPGELFVRAGVGVPLPFWRRRQGETAAVRAEQARVDVERAVGGRQVALEVDRALRAVALRDEQVRLDREEIVPAAEAALELLTQGWRAGKFDLFRVIQASREAGEAHRRALEDLGLLWEARIELSRAMGRS